MIKKVLIANRGEVAIRINTTLQKLGIESIGIYTNADRTSPHLRHIKDNVLLNDSEQTGYLDIAQIIAVAKKHAVDAIHPGYGFLSENSEFSRACHEANIKFIGPSAEVISSMGDKISARLRAEEAKVPIVPGVGNPGMSNEELINACQGMKYPLLVKPSAGGGGKGLHIVQNLEELKEALPVARREAFASFSDDTLFIEKYIKSAKHIEFQILRDTHGASIHLGERECSLQRRHQKVIEEAPSEILTPSMREKMGVAALLLVDAINYENIGTIEFLVDADNPEIFYFMEMNTRLQVEHRVTELVTGIDLVECQLRIAAGEHLKSIVPAVSFNGHAVEARVYSEDPYEGFLPSGGLIGNFAAPSTEDTVNDFAIESGTFVPPTFDPMLGKISCWAPTRLEAISLLRKALSNTVLLGVTTNIDFLVDLLEEPNVINGLYDTSYIEKLNLARPQATEIVFDSFALAVTSANLESNTDGCAWTTDNWRLSGSPTAEIAAYLFGERTNVSVKNLPSEFTNQLSTYLVDQDCWIHHPSFGTWKFRTISNHRSRPEGKNADEITSPMPGTVISTNVSVGDRVSTGDSLIIIEAMKMEHVIKAKQDGVIQAVNVSVGLNIKAGEVLLEMSDGA